MDCSMPGLPVLQHLPELIPINLHDKNTTYRDFPGGAVVKLLPSDAEDVGLIPGQDLRSYICHGQKTETENRDDIVTDSIKSLKNGLREKNKILKKNHLFLDEEMYLCVLLKTESLGKCY